MILGVTGPIGSGKSTVAKVFRSHGFDVIDADKIGHELLKKLSIKRLIQKEFGTTDRKKIRKIVLDKPKKFDKLNSIMWPEIKKVIVESIKKNKNKNIVVDAALLIEASWTWLVDKVIVVKSDRKKQIQRLIKTDRFSTEEVARLLKRQMPLAKKIKAADYVINNNASISDIIKQVNKIIYSLK